MQLLSNLSQNQIISIVVGVVLLVVVLVVFVTTRKQSYEELLTEKMENNKEVVQSKPENKRMRDYDIIPVTVNKLPERIIDGTDLYMEFPIRNPININYSSKGLNIPVEKMFYDDVDIWFIGSHIGISYIICVSPDGIIQQYSFVGSPDKFPEVDPSQLMGFKEPNQLVLVNPSNPQENIVKTFQREFERLSLIPKLNEMEKNEISKIGINSDNVIMYLYANELAFRRVIRNARLKLREMERTRELSYQEKTELINNTILNFMLEKDVMTRFQLVTQEFSNFNFDDYNKMIQNNGGEVNCRLIKQILGPSTKNALSSLDKILDTYKNMLNRLFSSIMTNSEKYLQYCSQDPQVLKSYKGIVNSLRFIISNKEFLQQVCPACPKVECPAPVCPKVECPACPDSNAVGKVSIDKRISTISIVQRKLNTPLNIASIEVYDTNGIKVTPDDVTMSPYELKGYPAKNLFDNDIDSFAHTRESNQKNPAMIVLFFKNPVDVGGIRVINRKDCCKDRILGATLELNGKSFKQTRTFDKVQDEYIFKI